jgi:hypothetical protein
MDKVTKEILVNVALVIGILGLFILLLLYGSGILEG